MTSIIKALQKFFLHQQHYQPNTLKFFVQTLCKLLVCISNIVHLKRFQSFSVCRKFQGVSMKNALKFILFFISPRFWWTTCYWGPQITRIPSHRTQSVWTQPNIDYLRQTEGHQRGRLSRWNKEESLFGDKEQCRVPYALVWNARSK